MSGRKHDDPPLVDTKHGYCDGKAVEAARALDRKWGEPWGFAKTELVALRAALEPFTAEAEAE